MAHASCSAVWDAASASSQWEIKGEEKGREGMKALPVQLSHVTCWTKVHDAFQVMLAELVQARLTPVRPAQNIRFYPTWLRYVRVFAIANPSVCLSSVTFVCPTQGRWKFRQYFFAILHLSHLLTSAQNLTEIVPWEPPVGGVKRKRGSKIEQCHVRVSHLLMSFS